eukprot:13857774-Alexandrium_andersonii.AAC.1
MPAGQAPAATGPSSAASSGPATAAGRHLAAGVRDAVAAEAGGAGTPIPPMPARPVPDADDDVLVQQ